MSGFFQNNKTAIHITSEVVIFGIAMFVIYRKTTHLSDNLSKLENRVRELETIIVEQRKEMDKLIQIAQSKIPQQFYVQPKTTNQQQYQPTPVPQQQYQPTPVPQQQYQPVQKATCATIVEEDEDELDKSLEEELKELEK